MDNLKKVKFEEAVKVGGFIGAGIVCIAVGWFIYKKIVYLYHLVMQGVVALWEITTYIGLFFLSILVLCFIYDLIVAPIIAYISKAKTRRASMKVCPYPTRRGFLDQSSSQIDNFIGGLFRVRYFELSGQTNFSEMDALDFAEFRTRELPHVLTVNKEAIEQQLFTPIFTAHSTGDEKVRAWIDPILATQKVRDPLRVTKRYIHMITMGIGGLKSGQGFNKRTVSDVVGWQQQIFSTLWAQFGSIKKWEQLAEFQLELDVEEVEKTEVLTAAEPTVKALLPAMTEDITEEASYVDEVEESDFDEEVWQKEEDAEESHKESIEVVNTVLSFFEEQNAGDMAWAEPHKLLKTILEKLVDVESIHPDPSFVRFQITRIEEMLSRLDSFDVLFDGEIKNPLYGEDLDEAPDWLRVNLLKMGSITGGASQFKRMCLVTWLLEEPKDEAA